MKRFVHNSFFYTLLIFSSAIILFTNVGDIENFNSKKILTKVRSSSSPEASPQSVAGRYEYFFNLTRDPRTNSLPQNIRARELKYAATLPKKNNDDLNKTNIVNFDWVELGPKDVGGRTRAIGVDVNNSNIIIAAGTSGGIWKSSDNGNTWQLKNTAEDLLSITSIVQDKRSGKTNNWYAASGEYNGNSASDRGYRARFVGNGIYKSVDNGESWSVLNNTLSNPNNFDSQYDYISRIIINPNTGSIFIASNAFGIYRSADDGNNFSLSIGRINDHYYSDIAAAKNGNLVAVLSEYGSNSVKTNSPGIYKSTDDGLSWTDITPSDFTVDHQRIVLAISESNPDIVYVLTNTGNQNVDGSEEITLFKINIGTSTSTNLTANLPDFSHANGKMSSQSNYDLTIAVKPDDENFVIIGGTSLFRSTDGFSTPLASEKLNWIGGYYFNSSDNLIFYPNLHPDQHIIVFDPNDANKAWFGHDGGLSYTQDITNTSYTDFFPWVKKNNGYNITQFYTVAIPSKANDKRIMGGTQDNGTPHFKWDTTPTASKDLTTGDGAYAYYGDTYAYASIYNGQIYRLSYNFATNIPYSPFTEGINWSEITPTDASNQLFINPFAVDPNKENVIYYPAGASLWRNDKLYTIPNYENGTTEGWTNLTNLSAGGGYVISTMEVSKSNPTHVLYYGASSSSAAPKIFKLNNATTAISGALDISIPGAENGAYVHDIAVNPEDANDIIVVLSNYNIIGLYHSIDGGTSYTAVEGNLTGTTENPGPSIRAALIHPYNGDKYYFAGTSTGLYSTTILNGGATVWQQESPQALGNVVVEFLADRSSDHTIAAATHGRGLYWAKPGSTVDVDNNNLGTPEKFALAQNYPNPFNPSTSISFSLQSTGNVNISIFNSIGEKVETLINEEMISGNHSINFNAKNLSSGIYYYKLTTSDFTATKKMLLLK